MAGGRDDAVASVLIERTAAVDIVAARDALARLVRLPHRLAPTLTVAGIAVGAAGAAALLWAENPLLGAGGAVLALALAAGGVCWRLHAAKLRAEAASAAKTRLLAAIGEDLRTPLRSIARAGAAIDRTVLDPDEWDKIARMRVDARAMLQQLGDIRTCLEIETGSFAPETRSFDLYRLANGVVAALRPLAAERGIVVALRINPLLPYQLRGWPHQLRQILVGLLTHAVQQAGKTRVRLVLDAVDVEADRVELRVAVAGGAIGAVEPVAASAAAALEPGRPFGLAMVERIAGLMGGRLTIERDPHGERRLVAELPFAIDQAVQAVPLDLAHLPALIVTKDAQFVGELAEPLDTWRGDARWIGAGDAALDYLAAFDAGGRRPLLVIDGRGDVMQALSFAHRAVGVPAGPPPYLLFVADEARMDSVIGLADEDFDGILPSPFTANGLRGVLHAMRVEPADWFLAEPLPAAEEPARPVSGPTPPTLVPRAAPAGIVTEIASHPRFGDAGAAVLDERALAALWSLGDGARSFDGLIAAFRAESRRVLGELGAAARAADPLLFEDGVQALRRCTANFGGGRLRELLLSLRNLAPAELARQGAAYVERLESELDRLDASLVDYANAAR